MRPSLPLILIALVVLIPASVQASGYDLGVSLIVDLPQEDFANISGSGGGAGLKFLFPLGSPMARFRADIEALFFGEDEHRGDVFGWEGEVITRHESIRLLAGLDFIWPPARSLQVYAAPMAGLYIFRSIDRIPYSYLSETSSSEAKFGWQVDSGIVITRFKRPHRPEGIGLDFGVAYGTVQNAIKTELEDFTIHTDANEIMIHAGLIWHMR